jgi:hypothetical protein
MNAIKLPATPASHGLVAGLAAAAPGHHHARIGLPILVLLVVGALSFGVVRLNRRRLAGGRKDKPVLPPGPAPGQDRSASSPEVPSPRPLAAGAGGWAVETHGLTKRFGTNVAVDDVELLVPRGRAFGYLGAERGG